MKLEVHHLVAHYGRAQILFDISLKVDRGEVVALLGRNGAGKSTVLRSVLGLVERIRGRVLFDGRDITHLPTNRIVRRGLGFVPEDRRVFADLTVKENLIVGQRRPRPGLPAWSFERVLTLFPNLASLLDRLAGQISGGEQQMLTIARTLVGNPTLILLDEPSEGLAPLIVEQMAHAIIAMKSQGLSILLAEQNTRFARTIADRAYIIEGGRVRYAGGMAALAADPALSLTYLAV